MTHDVNFANLKEALVALEYVISDIDHETTPLTASAKLDVLMLNLVETSRAAQLFVCAFGFGSSKNGNTRRFL
jgi:hypothetical protein